MASETLEVFSVLANRLGAWSLKAELEDLSFKALHPEDYAATAAAIAAHTAVEGSSGSEDTGKDTDGGLGAHLEAVAAALAEAGLQVVDVSGRVKNVYGVWKKMKDGGRVEEVFDVQALRVVVPHKHDCYAALRAVEGLWAPVPGRFKDYIRHKKANGYQVGGG
jgi:(p)ppGpp synthase/HD superfamily hydrolase